MKTISQHIEKLLAQHDYVVVQGLGGFVVQYQTAVISDERIIPPLATVGFNALMHHADGLLAIEIARTEGISYRMAVERIQKEVADLKLELESAGTVSIGNLGTFSSSIEGFHFSPTKKAAFLPCNFQLADLYVTPLSLRQKNEVGEGVKRIALPGRHFYKYAAVGLLAVGLFFVSPRLNNVSRTVQADMFSMLSVVTDTLFASEDTTIVAQQSNPEVKIEKKAEAEQSKYHVVVASFDTSKRALQYCEELKETYSAAHVVEGKHKVWVVLQSFLSREDALKYMEEVRKTDSSFESAWVMCE